MSAKRKGSNPISHDPETPPEITDAWIVDADVKLTHRADWILTRGYDALSVVVGV